MKEILVASLGLGFLGFLFSFILSLADKKLSVQEDPKIKEILGILPGINCGACGFSGCRAFAQEILKRKSLLSGCIPGGEEVNKKVSEILGLKEVAISSKKAVLLCSQDNTRRVYSSQYKGPQTCALAHLTGGGLACRYGCLGFGDCLEACKFDALKMEEGLPRIDYAKCTGCGACLKACPRNLFILVDCQRHREISIPSCSNPEDTLHTKKVCSVGCIGCGLCVRLTGEGYFYMQEGLARLNLDKYQGEDLSAARDKCPAKVIRKITLC